MKFWVQSLFNILSIVIIAPPKRQRLEAVQYKEVHILLSPPGVPELTTIFSGVRVARSLVFCVMICRSLFVLSVIVLSILRFTDSEYTFGIFKLHLMKRIIAEVKSGGNARRNAISILKEKKRH
jgi:hypothetical protein